MKPKLTILRSLRPKFSINPAFFPLAVYNKTIGINFVRSTMKLNVLYFLVLILSLFFMTYSEDTEFRLSSDFEPQEIVDRVTKADTRKHFKKKKRQCFVWARYERCKYGKKRVYFPNKVRSHTTYQIRHRFSLLQYILIVYLKSLSFHIICMFFFPFLETILEERALQPAGKFFRQL